ncbi:hypothetical protein [Aureibacter tunicatorum]|uniref:Uncharacterized protein n=1 Tax=Aureibacter tunicatorum TaxID=866807 RepID=A0AAE4BVK2_9BACT|nr:hypothetical protein [Aureibacter tunicatorum]MDR6241798.1 hypothetical protein [Aureibacter tunicatorum]BDD07045.1 hypothetical protein AUTU_45280 [Aureibacter tunicatorum]
MEPQFAFIQLSINDFEHLIDHNIILADISLLGTEFNDAYEKSKINNSEYVIINLHENGYFRFELSILRGKNIEDYPEGKMLAGNDFEEYKSIIKENIQDSDSKILNVI